MKSSSPEFYANASLSSQVLCGKHYISMYLDEYLLSAHKQIGHKNTPTPKP